MSETTPGVIEVIAQPQVVNTVADTTTVKTLTFEEIEQFLSAANDKEEYLVKIGEKFGAKIPYERLSATARRAKTYEDKAVELEKQLEQYKGYNPDATGKEIEKFTKELSEYKQYFDTTSPIVNILAQDVELQNLIRERYQAQVDINKIGTPETKAEAEALKELKTEVKTLKAEAEERARKLQFDTEFTATQAAKQQFDTIFQKTMDECKIPKEQYNILFWAIRSAHNEGLISEMEQVPEFIKAQWDMIEGYASKKAKSVEAEVAKRFNTVQPASGKPSSPSNKSVSAPETKSFGQMTFEERVAYMTRQN